MVNDAENDYVTVYDDGHVFHFTEDDDKPLSRDGKNLFEMNGWNKEEMVNFRLDIVSRYNPISDEELDRLAEDFCINEFPFADPNVVGWIYKAGYRKALEQ